MPFMKLANRIFIACLMMTNIAYADSLLKIENTWSPVAPPVAKVMAGYMTINNTGQDAVKITAAKSPLFNKVEIHLTEMKDGMMRMIKQENLTIPANSSVELKPGGLHMMLMGKLQAINAGSSIPVTLSFDNGESSNINLLVKENNAPMMHHHHH